MTDGRLENVPLAAPLNPALGKLRRLVDRRDGAYHDHHRKVSPQSAYGVDRVSRRDTSNAVHRHRQERWLHTRISEHLEDALKREARRRRLPVSWLVRNVLEGALDLVEDIVETGLDVARRSQNLAHVARGRRSAPPDEVYGWQALVLNRAATCARCEAALDAGHSAHRGLRDGSGPPVFLCDGCIDRLRQSATLNEEAPT